MHGLFQPNKGNWLLGALLHWRPHSKKPFWHQASCNRVDFKTNIASYDLRSKSGQLYDRHNAHNCQRRCNGQWWLGHAEYKGKLKSIQRLISKSLTENVRKSGDRNKCLYLYFRSLSAFISCPVSSYFWQTCWPSFRKSVKKSKKRSTSCWHASCLSFFCLALHVIHHTVWCFLFFFFTFLRLPQITILLIWLLLVFKYHRKLREPKGMFFIQYVNSL